MSTTLKSLNLGLRALMELGIVIALGYWGYTAGNNMSTRILLSIATPLIGFGFWGLVDFRRAGALAEPLRLVQELVISGLAALAWYTAGAHIFGWMLGIVSLIHHILVYVSGGTLLGKQAPQWVSTLES